MTLFITWCFYIEKARHFSKSNIVCVTFLYTKIQTLCKNQDNIRYVLYKKARHFTSRHFPWFLWNWHLYTKSMALCVAWSFYIQKQYTSETARQFSLRFYTQKSWHFASRKISWNFWNWRRGEGHFYMKKMRFVLNFICKKQCTLCYILIYKNQTLCVTYLYEKKSLCVMFLYLKLIV